MEIFKSLEIKSNGGFEDFKNAMLNKSIEDWHVSFSKEYDSLVFEYIGGKLEKAKLFLAIKDNENTARVVNIVPTNKFQLSIAEYNLLLDEFYRVFLYGLSMGKIEIDMSSSSFFNPLDIISEQALRKLELFCNCANKSTGSTHPLDRERWLDFISQTVIDGDYFDYSLLVRFLQDEDYWGKRESWITGKSAWSEEMAQKLASEYESFYEAMEFIKERLNG